MITGLKGTSHNYGSQKTKSCKSCETEFSPYHPRQRYCSEGCQRMAARRMTKSWKEKSLTTRAVKSYNLRKYGISVDEYEDMVESRDSCCDVCGGEENLHVDHCHTSGDIRGLLCRNCNTGLGLFKDSEKSLYKAIEYLKKAYGNGSS